MDPRIIAVVEQASELAKLERQETATTLRGVVKARRELELLEASLRAEEKQLELTANLKLWGRFCWKDLNESNKWKKENVLAVFVSGRLPAEFTERLWNQTAPESIRNDKEIILARLARKYIPKISAELLNGKQTVVAVLHHRPEILKQDILPEEFLDDEDVFHAYIQSPHTDYASSLDKFSAGIRGNADLMLEAAKRFGCAVFANFDESLRDDCCFATRLAETADSVSYYFSLDRFGERVRANPEVVLAFVRRKGTCLIDADSKLLGNQDIVRTACTNSCSARAFLSATSLLQQQLGRDRAFMMRLFAKLYYNYCPRDDQDGDPRLFRILPENLKFDRDVMVAANRCGSLSFSDIPASLSDDAEFWLDMIRRDSFFWYGLPVTFEQEPGFAHAIEEFESVFLVQAVFERFPALKQDRSVWFKIIASEFNSSFKDGSDDCSHLRSLIRDHMPEKFLLDRELMLLACARRCDVLLELGPTFGEDREFNQAAIENDDGSLRPSDIEEVWSPLRSMSFNAQRLHPDLLVEAISKEYPYRLHDQPDLVAPDLWPNLKVLEAWANVNGCAVVFDYPENSKSIPEFGLALLRVWGGQFEIEFMTNEFVKATTDTLRSDKSFMLKAVKCNAHALVCARGGLQRDFDVIMAAFDSKNEHAENFAWDLKSSDRWDAERPFLRRILDEAEQYLAAHDGFTKAFLHGMTPFAGESCRLSMLINDKHTALGLKQKKGCV